LTAKQLTVLLGGAALALVVVIVSDRQMRVRARWLDPERPSSTNTQPLGAEFLMPARERTRVNAIQLEERAESAATSNDRGQYFLKAADILKGINEPKRMELFYRIIEECPAGPLHASAYMGLIQVKTAAKPPQSPKRDVEGLIGLMKTVGLGEGKIDPKLIEEAAKVLEKPFPAECQSLRDALSAAQPAPAKEPEKK
jgi:hypothetical protein